MPAFTLQFNLNSYHQLDEYALLSCQAYNFGNDNDWFGSFRGGLYGSYARIHGVCSHYHTVHSWIPRPRLPSETEYHLASLFFNMDSFIECITYALNAFGYCASGNKLFRDVTCENGLRQISPRDILGNPNANPPKIHLPEYDSYFPEVRKYWQSKSDLINRVFEQHDVSKHRETIFVGGKCSTAPPLGFFESIGIDPKNSSQTTLFQPMEEIIIAKDPKIPKKNRTPQPLDGRILLETLIPEFQEFAEKTGDLALSDAKTHIKLKVAAIKKS
jgi:hypothetical protein